MQKYSERLGLITKKQFQKALDTFDLGTFLKAEPISQGLFGQNVYISSDKGEYVLRGAPHYDWQFKNEKLFVDLLAQKTAVPVPYPFLLSSNKKIFGWEFIIMPRMVGINLSDSLSEDYLNDVQRVQVAIAQSDVLKEAQKLTYPNCGKYDLEIDAIKPYENDWFEFYAKQILEYLRKSAEYNNNTTETDIAWVTKLIDIVKTHMEPFDPTFYMQDFKPGNMVISEETGVYKVSGLFDFMEASFGHPEADLSRMFAVYIEGERSDLAHTFIESYLPRECNIEKVVGRFPLFMLHDRAIIWGYCQRKPRNWKNVFWKDNLTFKEWFSNYITIDASKLM